MFFDENFFTKYFFMVLTLLFCRVLLAGFSFFYVFPALCLTKIFLLSYIFLMCGILNHTLNYSDLALFSSTVYAAFRKLLQTKLPKKAAVILCVLLGLARTPGQSL